jgi:methyltransferase (TIGR00027 family)
MSTTTGKGKSNSLGSTARWTAAARALESARADRLLNDPWAARLAGAEDLAWAANRPPDGMTPMILRNRFFDDFLHRIARDNVLRQMVLMAAGLDTRAFRLEWPAGASIFKLDQPAVLG